MSVGDQNHRARRIITGPPGSGKTRGLIEIFLRAVENGNDDKTLFLVPDSVAREHIRDLIARTSHRAFSDSGIQSIHSLISKLGGYSTASGSHIRALIRDAVDTGKLRSSDYGILGTDGGIDLLEAAVTEVRRSGLTEIPASGHNPLLKLLSRTLKLWQDWLDANEKFDIKDILDNAVKAAGEKSYDLVLIDGFTDIQPMEWKVLEAIIGKADETVVSIDPQQYPSDKLLQRFREAGFVEEPVNSRHEPICADLRWLGDVDLCDVSSRKPDSCPETLSKDRLRIVNAGNPQIEASEVVREIARCIEAGYEYRDIAVIAPNLGEARKALSDAFRKAGIPVRFYVDVPLIETAPGALTATFLELIINEWSDDLVLKLITNPLSGVSSETAAKIVPIVKSEYAINTKDKWLSDKNVGTVEILKAVEKLMSAQTIKPSSFSRELIGILEPEIGNAWRESGDDLTSEEGWAWEKTKRSLIDAALALDEISGALPPSEIAEFLFSELGNAKGRPFDRRSNCVNAVTMLDSRTWGVPVAIVMGLSDDNFPHRQRENPFLPDTLRIDLNLPEYEELRKREESMFRVAVTRARDRLVLSWPSGNLSGSQNRMSAPLAKLIDWVATEAGIDPVAIVPHNPPHNLDNAVLITDAVAIGYENDIVDNQVINILDSEYEFSIGDAVHTKQYDDPVLLIADDPKNFVLGTAENPISPTHLNNLAQCPYKFFASRVLGLKPYDRDGVASGFDYMMWGTVAHSALQEWFKGGKTADFETLVRNVVAKQRQIPDDSVTEARIGQIVDALELLKDFEEKYIRPLGFEQKYGEYEFNSEAKRRGHVDDEFHEPVKIRLDNGDELILGGRIDRIDVRDGDIALVADYKRSRTQDQNKLKNGQDLQLACYILLAEKGLNLDVAIACLLPITKLATKGGAGKIIYKAGIEGTIDTSVFKIDDELEMESHINMALGVISGMSERFGSGQITPKPFDPDECGKKCAYFDLCRYKFSEIDGLDEDGERDA